MKDIAELARIMIAPNGARLMKTQHAHVPVTVAEIVREAYDCHQAGANGIHVHVRDAGGLHVLDAGLYREVLAELAAAVPSMQCQISTEAVGRYRPDEQISVVRQVMPDFVSVGLRELCSGGWNAHVEHFYKSCHYSGIAIQHILYNREDLDRLVGLVECGSIPNGKLQVLFVLGRYARARVATLSDLQPFLDGAHGSDLELDWAVCAFGPHETDILRHVLASGGKARIGFENNVVNADGSSAASNAERVRDLLADPIS